jgi:hypothetical protein
MAAVEVKILKKRAAPEPDFKTRLMADLDALLPGDAFAFEARPKARPGIPDILIIHRGRALGLELAGGRLSDDQNAMVLKLRAAGMRIEVARSWSEALRALREMGVALADKDTLTRQVAEIFRDAQKGQKGKSR